LSQLQEKLKAAQNKLARAEGAQESIKANWKKELGTDNPEEVALKLKAMEAELEEFSESYDDLVNEAQVLLLKAEGV
jgi:uncharacterized protein YsxB (DUF464 family)